MSAEGAVACPDCSGTWRADHLMHDSTCPIGMGADQAMESDRAWFALHPGARERVRPITPAELAELRIVHGESLPWPSVTHLLVTQLRPGLRVRSVWMPGGAT